MADFERGVTEFLVRLLLRTGGQLPQLILSLNSQRVQHKRCNQALAAIKTAHDLSKNHIACVLIVNDCRRNRIGGVLLCYLFRGATQIFLHVLTFIRREMREKVQIPLKAGKYRPTGLSASSNYSQDKNWAYNVAAWQQLSAASKPMGQDAVPIAFFSYCREDSEFALKLAADLKVAGAHVWIDQLDIEPGTPWDRAVEDALTNSPHMLVVLSPVSVKSDNVRDEVSFALSRQKRVIPVLYRDCDVPFRLARLQHIDFRADYARAMSILLRALGVGHAAQSQMTVGLATAAAAEMAVSPAEAEEKAQQQREAEDRAVQEHSRREQRAAEQARLAEEARVAAERVRMAQEEKERREAEIQARQEQLRREEQESIERKSWTPEALPPAEQRELERVVSQPAKHEGNQPAPVVVPVAKITSPKPQQGTGVNLTSPKYLAGGAAAILALAFILFLVVHRGGPQQPTESKVEEKSSEPAGQQPQAQMPAASNLPEPVPPSASSSSTAPTSAAGQDKEKTNPAVVDKQAAKAKNLATSPKELSDLALPASSPALNAANTANADNPAPSPKRVRLSQGVSHGMLMYEVAPKYPPLARSAHVQGQVVLSVVIGKDGSVTDIKAESGHPLLIPSAIDAVKHWRYKPYKLNGKPAEVDTKVIVNFTLTNS